MDKEFVMLGTVTIIWDLYIWYLALILEDLRQVCNNTIYNLCVVCKHAFAYQFTCIVFLMCKVIDDY